MTMGVMRVLHCIPTLESGGAERQLAYVTAGLVELGIEAHIALLRGGVNLARAATTGAGVHFVPHSSNHDPRILRELMRLIGKLKPNLVQTWLPQMDVLGGLAARLRGRPFVLSERSSEAAYPPTWKNRLRRSVGKRAALIIANSTGGLDYWARLGGEGGIALIRNVVPINEIDDATPAALSKLGIADDAELILYVGRYSYEKNLETLIAALCRVLHSRPRAVALLHGEGPERDAAAERARLSGLGDRLRVRGFTPEVWALMKSARCFVSVSDFEGNPNTVLEAAACGSPLVISDIPAHREQFGDDSARLVPPRSVEAIAAAIEATLDDPAGAQRRAAAARTAVAGSSASAVAARYIEAYRKVLQPQSQ